MEELYYVPSMKVNAKVADLAQGRKLALPSQDARLNLKLVVAPVLRRENERSAGEAKTGTQSLQYFCWDW